MIGSSEAAILIMISTNTEDMLIKALSIVSLQFTQSVLLFSCAFKNLALADQSRRYNAAAMTILELSMSILKILNACNDHKSMQGLCC